MKRIFKMILSVTIILSLICLNTQATGTVIGDGGGGSMGNATGSSWWNNDHEGIRVSVVNLETKTQAGKSVDFSNIQNPAASYWQTDIYHSDGLKNKLHYMNGGDLYRTKSTYTTYVPSIRIPPIVKSNTATPNIDAIKAYFQAYDVVCMIANETGVPYATLTSGKYTILFEPVGYFLFNGQII